MKAKVKKGMDYLSSLPIVCHYLPPRPRAVTTTSPHPCHRCAALCSMLLACLTLPRPRRDPQLLPAGRRRRADPPCPALPCPASPPPLTAAQSPQEPAKTAGGGRQLRAGAEPLSPCQQVAATHPQGRMRRSCGEVLAWLPCARS